MKTNHYNPAEIFDLLRANEHDVRKAARVSGIKEDTIKNIVYKNQEYKAERDRYKAVQREKRLQEIRDLFNEGKTIRYIMRALNADRRTIKEAVGLDSYKSRVMPNEGKRPRLEGKYYKAAFYY